MKGKERGIGKVREEVYTATDDFVTEKKRRENQVGKTAQQLNYVYILYVSFRYKKLYTRGENGKRTIDCCATTVRYPRDVLFKQKVYP